MPKTLSGLRYLKKFQAVLHNKLTASTWLPLVWLGLLAGVCYGILIPALGFYWDDLPYLYQYAVNGPSGFPAYVAPDRPFSAWIFMLTTSLFGFNPLGYHLLALILRWLCAVLIYIICRELWPNNRLSALISASASILYPGFSQQPIALIYNHHFSIFAAFLLSLYTMILSVKREKNKTLFTLLSMFLSLGMFSIENFSTLELIRPFVLLKLLREKDQPAKIGITALRALKAWLPYFAVFLTFLLWRVFIFSFPTYKPEFLSQLREAPLPALFSLLARILPDLYTSSAAVWLETITLPSISDFGRSASILYWMVVLLASAATAFAFSSGNTRPAENTPADNISRQCGLEMIAGAVVLFFAAGALIWVLNLPVVLEFSNNRLLLAFIPAAVLLLGGIFACFPNRTYYTAAVLAVLFGFAAGTHFQNGMAYKRDWENLQAFLSQLSWRVPSLAENSILITSETGLRFYSDSSLTSPVNLMYTDELDSTSYPHLVYTTYSPRTVPWFEEDDFNADYTRLDRSFTFSGNSAHVLSYLYRPPGCLQFLDDTYSNAVAIANLTELQVKEIPFSNLNVITRRPQAHPFPPLFSEADQQSWCYFFEKADLARQFRDFQTASALGNSAIAGGFAPRIASEWLPFLEAYLWTGDWDRSAYVIAQINAAAPNYRSGMCYTLRRIHSNEGFPFREQIAALIGEQQCR